MVSRAQAALRRLRELVDAHAIWLQNARVDKGPRGARLRVPGLFQKRWLEERYADELRMAFDGPVEVVAEQDVPEAVPRAAPQLRGPVGEFALRMVTAFVDGGPPSASLVVLHGPPRCGKSVLTDWAVARAGPRAFRLDLERLRAGGSRGLVPRKPLVVADGLEILAGRERPQRTLCTILDAVRNRGDRLLFSLQGHPGRRPGLFPGLRNRLLGGVLVRVEAAEPAAAPPRVPSPLAPIKEQTARLFGVERALLDSRSKRRRVVAARRAAIAAAHRRGVAPLEIAASFGIGSLRTVRDACRWAESEAGKDRHFAALLHEIIRSDEAPL